MLVSKKASGKAANRAVREFATVVDPALTYLVCPLCSQEFRLSRIERHANNACCTKSIARIVEAIRLAAKRKDLPIRTIPGVGSNVPSAIGVAQEGRRKHHKASVSVVSGGGVRGR